MQISLYDILQAKRKIQDYLVQTPLIYSEPLSQATDANIWLKLESLQKTGSFKPRGACNKIFSLARNELQNGVITASAGNHAQGVALAAKQIGCSALIVVPETTPETKQNGIKQLGAKLLLHGSTYDEAEAYAQKLAQSTGRIYIHAFEDPLVIAGQGTLALEALWEQHDFDMILVPSGGGGLICGVAIAAKAINPKIKVIGVQSHASPPWYYSFKQKHMVDVEYSNSLAEGLHGRIGYKNFKLALQYVDDFVLVEEQQIAEAMSWMATYHHQMIEGSAAVGIAALLQPQIDFSGKKILIVITGGNVDAKLLARLLWNERQED